MLAIHKRKQKDIPSCVKVNRTSIDPTPSQVFGEEDCYLYKVLEKMVTERVLSPVAC